MKTSKDLAFYKALPFRRTVEMLEEGGEVYFIARIEEIPFIRIDGATREEALFKLGETFEDCIAEMIARGDEIPEPPLWPGEELPPAQESLTLVDRMRVARIPAVGVAAFHTPRDWTISDRKELAMA